MTKKRTRDALWAGGGATVITVVHALAHTGFGGLEFATIPGIGVFVTSLIIIYSARTNK